MSTQTLGSLVDRVLLVAKPRGCTSHDVVVRFRRHLGCRRIGHAGTLDPFATGLLLLLIGRGTKLFPMLSCLDKEYAGVLQLGVETTTGDPAGEVTERASAGGVTRADVDEVARGLTGEQDQIPPMTSAVKHNGQPLYKLSRRGIEVSRQARRIRISRFDVLRFEDERVHFRVACSKGTYVRTLALEFGRRLGVGAHLTVLERTRIGEFRIEDAVDGESPSDGEPREILATYGRSLSEALAALDAVRLNPSGVRKVRCGVYPTPADLLDFAAIPEAGTLVQLLDPAGELVAVGRSSRPESGRSTAARIELVRVI